MARHRAPSVCSTPGCPNLKPCPEHTRRAWATSNRASRLPTNWSTIRQQVRDRDQVCQACGGTRCGNRNLEVDHITRGDNHQLDNLQLLGHDPCHLEKSLAESVEARTNK